VPIATMGSPSATITTSPYRSAKWLGDCMRRHPPPLAHTPTLSMSSAATQSRSDLGEDGAGCA
jgi:hypothetical protein